MTAAGTGRKALAALEQPTNGRHYALRAAAALVLARRGHYWPADPDSTSARKLALLVARESSRLSPDPIDAADADAIADHALDIADAIEPDPAGRLDLQILPGQPGAASFRYALDPAVRRCAHCPAALSAWQANTCGPCSAVGL